jgi:cold shock protein
MRGTIKVYFAERTPPYGFVINSDDRREYFLNRSSLEGGYVPASCDVVDFELREGRRGMEAHRIRLVAAAAATPVDADTPVMRGRVKLYDPARKYGFITRESDKRDFFYHYTDVVGSQILATGQLVEFHLREGTKGPQAARVQPVVEELPEGPVGGTIRTYSAETGRGLIALDVSGREVAFSADDLVSPLAPEGHDPIECTLAWGEAGVEARRIQYADVAGREPPNQDEALPVIGDSYQSLLADLAIIDAALARAIRAKLLAALANQDGASEPRPLACARVCMHLAHALFAAGYYEKADARALTAFDIAVALRPYGSHKALLGDATTLRVNCLVRQSSTELLQDVQGLRTAADVLISEMFGARAVIPRATRLGCNELIVREAEKQRRHLEGDLDGLRNLIARSAESLLLAPLPRSPELDQIRESWRKAAEEWCSWVLANVARSSTANVTEALLPHLETLEVARRSAQGTVPESVLDSLRMIAAARLNALQERAESVFAPIAPTKSLRSGQATAEQHLRLVPAQLDPANRNYAGALAHLTSAVSLDTQSAALWEWVAYVKLLMGRVEEAQNHLRMARTIAKADDATSWNLAYAAFRLEGLDVCQEELARVEGPQALDAMVLVALKRGNLETVLSALVHAGDLEYLVLAYTVAIDRNDAVSAKNALAGIVGNLRANQADFAPLPPEEELSDKEVQATLAYYLMYSFLGEGMRHFKARLEREQPPKALLLRALGQLAEADDKPLLALQYYRAEQAFIIKGRPRARQAEVARRVLDFCLRNNLPDKGREVLRESIASLSPKDSDDYEQRLRALTDEATMGAGARRSLSGSDVAEANQRIAELNRRRGRTDTFHKVREAREDFEAYADALVPVYGDRAGRAAKAMRMVVAAFADASVADNEEAQRAKLSLARQHLDEMKVGLEAGLSETEREELVLCRRLLFALADAERRVGRSVPPSLTVLTSDVTDGMTDQQLFVRTQNDGEVTLANVSLTASSERGVFQPHIGESIDIGTLECKQSRVVPVTLECGPTGDSDILTFQCRYWVDGVRQDRPGGKVVVRRVPFTPVPAERYFVGQGIPADRPENFHGRENEIGRILSLFEAARKGTQGPIYLDGIRRVGKSSLLNFVQAQAQDWTMPVRLPMMGFDFVSTGDVLRTMCVEVAKRILGLAAGEAEGFCASREEFEARPIQQFRETFCRIAEERPGRVIVLLIDEVQELLKQIGSSIERQGPLDARVLNAWQAELEEGQLLFLLTGSLRFSKLARLVQNHPFFGRVDRIRVGFLERESTRRVFAVPVADQGVVYSDEALDDLWGLTRGYASIVQRCGRACVQILNDRRRRIVAPQDVEVLSREMLTSDELFLGLWDPSLLGDIETAIMTTFMELSEQTQGGRLDRTRLERELTRLGSDFNIGLNNLLDQEILEQSDGRFGIQGKLLEQWMRRRFLEKAGSEDLNYCMLAIDHENLFLRMRDVMSKLRGAPSVDDSMLAEVVRRLLEQARQKGKLAMRFAVAAWEKGFLTHQKIYRDIDSGFQLPFPAEVRPQASDDELRHAVHEKVWEVVGERRQVRTVILVTGDGGYRELVRKLIADGRRVIVWSWNASGKSEDLAREATEFEAIENLVALDSLVRSQ